MMLNTIYLYLTTLPRSTQICLVVITILGYALFYVIAEYSELLKINIDYLKMLKITLGYIRLFDNSTQWDNTYNIVNQTLNNITIIKSNA